MDPIAHLAEDDLEAPPGSRLHWRSVDGVYVAGNYRIRLLIPERWEVCVGDHRLGVVWSRKLALALVEMDIHDRAKRHDLWQWGASTVAAIVALFALIGQWMHNLWLVLAVAVTMYALLSFITRFVATASGSLEDPYRRRLPGEARDWWRRG